MALMPAAMRSLAFIGFFGLLGLLMAVAPAAAQSRNSDEVSARPRPRVVIQRRTTQLPPNARRECRARLVQEYRVSGTVIVPQMNCWWE
jgi:hypothetical protein